MKTCANCGERVVKLRLGHGRTCNHCGVDILKTPVKTKVYRWIQARPQGTNSRTMWKWLGQAISDYTPQEFNQALITLRDEGLIICVDGLWKARMPLPLASLQVRGPGV